MKQVVVLAMLVLLVRAGDYQRLQRVNYGRPNYSEKSESSTANSRDSYAYGAAKPAYQSNECPCYKNDKLGKLKLKLIAAVVIPLFLIIWLLGTILLNVAKGTAGRTLIGR
jgi:TRAP-type mannitol/chloroaromatic compound transport system permease large subunit